MRNEKCGKRNEKGERRNEKRKMIDQKADIEMEDTRIPHGDWMMRIGEPRDFIIDPW